MSKKMNRLVGAFCWGFLAIFLLVATGQAAESSISRVIQYSFTVQNTSDRLLPAAEFWTWGPVKKTATQQCLVLEASQKFELLVDELGNQVLHFTFKNLPPFGVKIVRVKAELVLNEEPVEIPGDEQLFLGAEKYVEVDGLAIKKTAAGLKADNPLLTAKRIYSWVAANLEYSGFAGLEKGALAALASRQGDCTEYMDLFTALARAAGVPARRLGGYVVEANKMLRPTDYHNWAEFYDNGVWKLADAQKKNFAVRQADYIAMQIINDKVENPMAGFNRFRFEGEGLQVGMNL
jgi:hypothetical protein